MTKNKSKVKVAVKTVGEFMAAVVIVGMPFILTWVHYAITGQYMNFGIK
jgi:Flp pilus assembly protein TadB